MIDGLKLAKWLVGLQDKELDEKGRVKNKDRYAVLEVVIEKVWSMIGQDAANGLRGYFERGITREDSAWSNVSAQAAVCTSCGRAVNVKMARQYDFCPYCGRKIIGGPR